MKRKTKLLGTAAAAVLGLVLAAHAGLYSYDFSATGAGHYTVSASDLGQGIPDNDPSGVAYGINFGTHGLQLTDISVTFTTVGGWNGDLYAYLSHGDGFAVLLNRVGANTLGADGYSTAGFNGVTLSMTATTDIHGVALPTAAGGPYGADGRLAYTDTARNNTLGVFNNADPYGGWTLFFSDNATPSKATLTGWSLEITAVPEPVNVGLSCLAGMFLLLTLARSLRRGLEKGDARQKP
jgi:hypothetical protein